MRHGPKLYHTVFCRLRDEGTLHTAHHTYSQCDSHGDRLVASSNAPRCWANPLLLHGRRDKVVSSGPSPLRVLYVCDGLYQSERSRFRRRSSC